MNRIGYVDTLPSIEGSDKNFQPKSKLIHKVDLSVYKHFEQLQAQSNPRKG